MHFKMQSAILILLMTVVTETVCQVCDLHNSVELTDRSYNGVKYDEGEYIVDKSTGVAVERGCVCMKETCVRKCCPFGQGYDSFNKICVDLPEEFNISFKDSTMAALNMTDRFHFLIDLITCKEKKEGRFALDVLSYVYYLEMDGTLYYNYLKKDNILTNDKYCIDNFIIKDEETNGTTVEFDGFICRSNEQPNHYAVSATCMLISCIFILLTLAVYAFLPELRTLHGMVMTAFLLCFFVAFLFVAIMQVLLLYQSIQLKQCTVLAFFIYFSALSAFFWQNVMCYDLWSKFRASNLTHGYKSVRMRFLLYSSYAFGLPTALTILLAALEFSDLPYNKFLPHLRTHGCFLSGTGKMLYFNLPLLIICVSNLIFFVLIAKKIAHIKKQTQILQKKDKQRFSLYIKLFIVSGFSWVFEAIGNYFEDYDNLWQFTDAYNCLVGLLIFIIFIFKKKTWLSIKRRYNKITGQLPMQTQTSTVMSQSISQTTDDIQMKSTADSGK